MGFVVTEVADPLLHKLDVGGVEFPKVPPCDDPHVPLTTGAVCVAEHVPDAAPPPDPPQVHDHGPDPDGAGVATPLPAPQRLDDGAEAKDEPLAVPQVPATGVTGITCEQVAEFDPPLIPLQTHW